MTVSGTHKRDQLARYQKHLTAIDYIHEFNLDHEKREIYLFGEEDYGRHFDGGEPGVEYMMANRFIKNLRILQSLGDEPILIHMKTCGGEWAEGMAIYQAIKACPVYCVVLNYTHARSMSSIILQAADYRVMMPYSTFMFHDGTFGLEGTVKQAFTEIEQLRISSKQMMDIYVDVAEHGPEFEGKNRAQIRRWLRDKMDRKEEVYLDAEETVAHGFADFVFGGDGTYDWNKLRT
jgi:ATP-dependent protease ClpP protease subunit